MPSSESFTLEQLVTGIRAYSGRIYTKSRRIFFEVLLKIPSFFPCPVPKSVTVKHSMWMNIHLHSTV